MQKLDTETLKQVLSYPARAFLVTACPTVIEKDKRVVVFFTFPSVFQDHHFVITAGNTTKPLQGVSLKAAVYALKDASPNDVMEKVKQFLAESGFSTKEFSQTELRADNVIHVIISFNIDIGAALNIRTAPYGEKITAWMNGEVPVDAEFTPVETKKEVVCGEESGNI